MKSGTAMKINTNMLTDGMALHVTSNDGKMLQSIGTLCILMAMLNPILSPVLVWSRAKGEI